MVRLTFYGGVNEIGGNKILVEDRDTKLIVDFGGGFSEGEEYFSAGIEPRSVNGAGDYLEFGLLPEIRGLYSEDALENAALRYASPEIDGILLSHYHSDHMARIRFTDHKIPVHCGETTNFIHQAASESTGSSLDEHDLRTFRTGDKFKVGSIEVEPVHVDHSIPGAYGFILHTSEGPIAYTGDFRFHGPMGSMTEDFISTAFKAGPIALITEGTRVATDSPKRDLTEPDVAAETAKVLEKSPNLVFSSFRGNDTDRVVSFYKACEKTGRKLVVSMKVALLLEQLQADKHLQLPRVGSDVLVYVRRKKEGSYDDSDYYKWERKYLDKGITAEQVRGRQRDLLLHLDQWYFPELIDIKPAKGGAYIHATTEAYNEEGEEEQQVVKNWVEYFGFSYHQIHASGHAPIDKVAYLVNKINGKNVIPIHTERPDLFASFWKGKLSLPERGKRIQIG